MRSAGVVLGVLILVAAVATAAQDEKSASTTPGASSRRSPSKAGSTPPSTLASPAGATTTLLPDLDRFMGLHARIDALEKKLPPVENTGTERDPTVEQAMWTAFWALGMALTIAWVVGKFVENVDSERQAKVAMWKELVKATVPASTNADPQAALREFEIRLDEVRGQIRTLAGFAEQALSDTDAKLSALAPVAAKLRSK